MCCSYVFLKIHSGLEIYVYYTSISSSLVDLKCVFTVHLGACCFFAYCTIGRGIEMCFYRPSRCWSYVGFTHQVNQTVSIGDGCQSVSTLF